MFFRYGSVTLFTTLFLATCGWPKDLPESAAPGRAPNGTIYPDLLVTPGPIERARRDAAIIVSIETYEGMDNRTNAHPMAAAWYRYFRENRGMRPWRIKLLRDAEATPTAIFNALDEARWWVHDDNVLWFIFIGHISGKPDQYGAIWLTGGDGTHATQEQFTMMIPKLLTHLNRGHHPRSIAVFDGCMPSGLLPGGTATPDLPPLPFPPSGLIPDFPGSTYSENIAIVQAKTDLERGRNTPTDLSLFSSGFGDGCVESLPNTNFPALSYLVLGALRGWGDLNENGKVSAVEAITFVHNILHAVAPGTSARPSLFTADVTLAYGVDEQVPDLRILATADTPNPLPIPPPLIIIDDMVRFQEGAFRMGCPNRRDPICESDERPAHRVVLSRFFLDPYEVSVADYQRCVDRGDCTPMEQSRCFVWTGTGFQRGAPLPEPLTHPEHPMMCLTWYQAANYCQQVGKHLPTEAEWERAAAGLTQRKFPWGSEFPTCAQTHHYGCGEHTRPVGTHPAGATPEGVYDLAGNVSEWVYDWYAKRTYRNSRRKDPVGPAFGEVKVIRGGSYYDGPMNLRVAYRYGLSPDSGFSTVGFRCAR